MTRRLSVSPVVALPWCMRPIMFRASILVTLVMMLVTFLFVFVAFATVVVMTFAAAVFALFASGPVSMFSMVGVCGL